MINLLHGDCLEQMKTLDDNSVDSIVSDPPYGISFMAKKWDYDVPSVEVWKEAMRVLKPGGHALIACGTRTQHRMVCNIEDAGFEIRDVVSWIYGSGFPKSLNISKAIDKAAGAEREKIMVPTKKGNHAGQAGDIALGASGMTDISEPATDEAKQWDGWGTALKPACEFFTLARKPLSEKTIAANVLKWGTGGINIDGCRVGTEEITVKGGSKSGKFEFCANYTEVNQTNTGRFPANLIHDGSQEVLDLFPETNPSKAASRGLQHSGKHGGICEGGDIKQGTDSVRGHNDNGGSAARFFYCPKASKKDRNEGCEGFEDKEVLLGHNQAACPKLTKDGKPNKTITNKNTHPTVKPTALMSYLCRLITPTGGVVLDPYMGSGSTGKAAVREGFSFVGCELDEDYFQIAKSRVENAYYQ
jgi:DNA modification methylase